MKRLRELKDGVPIEKVAANMYAFIFCKETKKHNVFFIKFSWKATQRKFAGKSETFDELVESAGVDNITKFVER